MTLKESKFFKLFLAFTFLLTSLGVNSYANEMMAVPMPTPGAMVPLSTAYIPANLMGLEIDPQNPFHIDFLISNGQDQNKARYDSDEYLKMVKYFMSSLTVPNKDQWVNLSPYENNRIITNELGFTEMGRDLLSQDYLLKQLTASLIYPEKVIGQKFWKEIYQQIYAKYGSNVKIPVNTFNKVWIMPESAVLYQKGNQIWIVKSSMKVMLDTDYIAMMKSIGSNEWGAPKNKNTTFSKVSADIIRHIILPVIKNEVNTGKNFAVLRQIYNAMVLATWYKLELKQSILTKVYGDAKKVKGIDLIKQSTIDHIYQQYIKAYKKGVFNFIKEDIDPISQQAIPRKYFSGGFTDEAMSAIEVSTSDLGKVYQQVGIDDIRAFNSNKFVRRVSIKMTRAVRAMSAMASFALLLAAPQMANANAAFNSHTALTLEQSSPHVNMDSLSEPYATYLPVIRQSITKHQVNRYDDYLTKQGVNKHQQVDVNLVNRAKNPTEADNKIFTSNDLDEIAVF